ncbi:helix-turn-helix domain-containing protein [Cohnella suwonensis]|uniref:Helix-turn-helix domain-containing protein n=1 Tax=Cohnella suwonensis TaxID=696072 RepID=A0ABW0LSA3_9BACL
MDRGHLREDRRHGSPAFPIAAYEIERNARETILDSHWHDEAEFLWIVSGRAEFQVGLTSFELRAGEGMFVPCGELHGGYPLDDSPCVYKAVVFHLDWFASAKDGIASRYVEPLQRGEAMIPARYDGDTEWGASTLKRLASIADYVESEDAAKELRVKSELLSLFADLVSCGKWQRKAPANPVDLQTIGRLKGVVAYIEQYSGQALNVDRLAAVAGMSAGHFSRVFKAFMRKSPMDYVNYYRIRQAAHLLQNTDRPVAVIALEVGIDNFSYFSKRFKDVYDCTPTVFRKKFNSL